MSEPLRRFAVEKPAFETPMVRLIELAPPALLNVRLKSCEAAGAALGRLFPPPRRFAEDDQGAIAWLGPDEWLLIGQSEEAHVAQALGPGPHAVTDVSGNRAQFRLSGPGARAVLAAGCSLDLHPRAFAPGACAQTLLARAQILLLQRDGTPTYDIFPRRSFASYVWNWLVRAAEVGA